jgi:hypothetical protein
VTASPPIRLSAAAEKFGVKVEALRRARDAGKLETYRFAGKDWTTLAAVERMFELCRVERKAPTCGSGPPGAKEEASAPPSGSSETGDGKSAQAALSLTIEKLKSGLRATSSESAKRRGASVISLRSRSPTSS